MKLSDAQARLETFVGEPLQSARLYGTRADLPGENQPVMLLGFTHDQQFKIGVIGAYTEPWVVAVPDWETTRRGRRERERDLIRLYIGRAIWARRSLKPTTSAMLARAEKRCLSATRHPDVVSAVVHEIVRVPGFGGTHITLRLTDHRGREGFQNQRGREHWPAKTVLRAIAEHPTWFFLGLEFGA